MRILKLFSVVILIVYLESCAGVVPPTPEDVIRKPLGTESVKIGMTKDRVRDLWGEPDHISFVKDEDRWGGEREEWIYEGKYSALPIDAGYLSRTKRLYFDGENLTNIVED